MTDLDLDAIEARAEDWRRRYEALRDGVTGLCDEYIANPHPSIAAFGREFRAVVARVEGDES